MEKLLVDVELPVLGIRYELLAKPDVTGHQLLAAILKLAGEREDILVKEDNREFLLADREKECLLDPARTLKEQGVTSGDRLLIL